MLLPVSQHHGAVRHELPFGVQGEGFLPALAYPLFGDQLHLDDVERQPAVTVGVEVDAAAVTAHQLLHRPPRPQDRREVALAERPAQIHRTARRHPVEELAEQLDGEVQHLVRRHHARLDGASLYHAAVEHPLDRLVQDEHVRPQAFVHAVEVVHVEPPLVLLPADHVVHVRAVEHTVPGDGVVAGLLHAMPVQAGLPDLRNRVEHDAVGHVVRSPDDGVEQCGDVCERLPPAVRNPFAAHVFLPCKPHRSLPHGILLSSGMPHRPQSVLMLSLNPVPSCSLSSCAICRTLASRHLGKNLPSMRIACETSAARRSLYSFSVIIFFSFSCKLKFRFFSPWRRNPSPERADEQLELPCVVERLRTQPDRTAFRRPSVLVSRTFHHALVRPVFFFEHVEQPADVPRGHRLFEHVAESPV